MEQQQLSLTVKKFFGNLYRKQCVLIVVEDSDGKILLGTKPHYPPSIVRLIGGGVEAGEALEAAACRELGEELAIEVKEEGLRPLAQFSVSATDDGNKSLRHDTYLYYCKLGGQTVHAGDDIGGVVRLAPKELDELGTRYDELHETLWYHGPGGVFSWADYGKMYGPIHHFTAQALQDRK